MWETACAELSQRFGPEQRIFRQDDVELGLNMEEVYRLLFVPLSTRREIEEAKLLNLWDDLASFERRRGRPVLNEELGRFRDYSPSKKQRIDRFISKTLASFWYQAVLAWADGWLLRLDLAAVADVPLDPAACSEVSEQEVKVSDDGRYVWRRFKVEAAIGKKATSG